MNTFLGQYFYFCSELALHGNMSQSFYDAISAGSWPWLYPLISELSMQVRPLQPANAPPDQNVAAYGTVPEILPLQGERSGFYTCLC